MNQQLFGGRGLFAAHRFLLLLQAFFAALGAFFGALRDYVDRYGGANASTSEFEESVEQSTGRDLAWFFRQWVVERTEKIDRPALKLSWSTRSLDATRMLDVTIDQATADVLLYRLPMRIAVSWPGGERSFDVVDSLAHQTFHLEVPQEPASVRLDPRHDVFFTLIP